MSSKIEQLIDELEEYIENCKPTIRSSSKIIVNKDEIDDLLRELRMKTPDEIKKYQKIINNRDEILNDAKAKAKTLIEEATVHKNELISEHEIMQKAYEQANSIVAVAAKQAQEILDKATIEANELRTQASRYTEERLMELNAIVVSAIENTSVDYKKTIDSLVQYRDIIQSNIRSLHPMEGLDDISLEEPGENDAG